MKEGPYSLRYEQLTDGWCRAVVAEHPNVFAEAPTRDEAREMTLIALRGMLHATVETQTTNHLPVIAA